MLSSLSMIVFGLAFTIIGLVGLSVFSGMLTDSEFRRANGVSGALIPNGLFLFTTVVGVINLLHGFGVISA